MPDVVTAFQVLRDTPLPNILVIAGVILIFLAIVGQFVGQIEIQPDRQKWAGVVGIIFLFSGVGLYLVPNSGPPPVSLLTPTPNTPTPTESPAPEPPSDSPTPIPTITVPVMIAQEGDVTELNILWAQWDPADYLQEVGNMYEEEFGIKVNVIQEPWSSFGDRFFSETAAQGTSYDMVVGQSQWLGYGSTQGHYLELTDFLRETGIADTVTPAALTYYSEYPTNSGHYWAYPTEGDAVGWAYRKDLFEDPEEQAAFKKNYGYALAPPETLEQLMDIAKFFTRPDKGLYGVAIYTQTDYEGITWGFQNILFSYGGDWKDVNNNAVGVINSPKAVTALEYYKELYRCCQSPGLSNAYFAETNDAFIGGQVAMAMNFFTFFPALVNPVVSPYAEQTGFFVNPAGPDGQQHATRGGQNISIISHISPERQEAAKRFIQWFAQEKIQAEWARFGGYTCNIKVLQSQEFLDATPFNTAFAKTIVFIKDFWNIPIYDQLLRITQAKLSNYVVNEQGTAQEALDNIAEQHQQILKKGGFIPVTTEANTTIPPIKPTPGASLNMVLLPKFLGLLLFDQANKGAQEAATELQTKGELQFLGPTPENSAAGQIEIIETATAQGINAVMISNNAGDQIVPAVQAARESGVTVVTWDSSIPSAVGEQVFISPVDWSEPGQVMADLALSILGRDGGRFAILSAAREAENQNSYIAAMINILKNNPKYTELELLEIVYGNDDPEESYNQALTLANKYPDMELILAPTAVGIVAAAKAMQDNGLCDRIKVSGFGTPAEMLSYTMNGCAPKFALWNFVDLGYLTYYTTYLLASGQMEAKEGVTFEAGRMGIYTIEKDLNRGKGLHVIMGPWIIYDRSNIEAAAK